MGIEDVRTTGELVGRLTGQLRRIMPPGARRERLVDALDSTFAGDRAPVDAAGCRAIETVAQRHSRHLELHLEPSGIAVGGAPDDEMPGWPPPDPAAIARRSGGIGAVRHLDHGDCLITLNSLEALGSARPYLEAATTLARAADRVILDLRANGGGDPATAAAVAGWLLGDASRQLSVVLYAGYRRQWWTPELACGTAFTGEVTVLISNRTYSSAEALAYHLAVRNRATLIGETTRGAADHVIPVRLAKQVLALLPEAEVRDIETGGNWEGVGVLPHVPYPAENALHRALTDLQPA
jgi:peptidase S41-like protein